MKEREGESKSKHTRAGPRACSTPLSFARPAPCPHRMYTQKAATPKKNHCCARKPGRRLSACALRASVNSSLTIMVCRREGSGGVLSTVRCRGEKVRESTVAEDSGTCGVRTGQGELRTPTSMGISECGEAGRAMHVGAISRAQRIPAWRSSTAGSAGQSGRASRAEHAAHARHPAPSTRLDAQHHEHEGHVPCPDDGQEGSDEDNGGYEAHAEGAVACLDRLR